MKVSIELSNGYLKYKSEIVYLGVIFSDTGRIYNDVKLFIQEKRSDIVIKYSNFCAKNYLAPLKVKLTVLQSCVMSSLSYSCETWTEALPPELETVYRMGIKSALSVRFNTCNEVAYIESGTYPAVCSIKKRQIKFWYNLNQNITVNSSLDKLLNKAKELRLQYITYYVNLQTKYDSAENCENSLQTEFIDKISRKIRDAYDTDNSSKLGAYYQVNPNLLTPSYQGIMFELERIHITLFRSGSHNLFIETGRFSFPRVPRELRICSCGSGIQTLRHVLMECPIVAQKSISFNITFTSMSEFLTWSKLHDYLLIISKVLKVEL